MATIDNFSLLPEHFFSTKLMRKKSMTWSLSYGNELEIRGPLKDRELSFGVSTDYSDSITDPIPGKITELFKEGRQLAPMFEKGGEVVEGAITSISKAVDLGFLGDLYSKGQESLRRGSSVMEKGINVAMNSLRELGNKVSLKTAHAGEPFKAEDLGRSSFISGLGKMPVFSQTDFSLPIPGLSSFIFASPAETNYLKNFIKVVLDHTAADTSDAAGMYGLQKAPNNYIPRLESVNYQDKPMDGTWTLRLGTDYVINNVLVTKFDFSLKTTNLLTCGEFVNGKTKPVYAEKVPYFARLNFDIIVAGFITKEDIIRMAFQNVPKT